LASQFKALSDQWRRETLHTSSLTKMITHPSYLRIIGMGQSVLPLLFRELEVRPDHWLVALNATHRRGVNSGNGAISTRPSTRGSIGAGDKVT